MVHFSFYPVLCLLLFFNSQGVFAQSGKTSVLIQSHVYSQALQEKRDYCLYLPADFNPEIQYPLIIAADGQMISEGTYQNLLDSLIENKIIPPLVLIGINSNEQEVSPGSGVTLRYYEYAHRNKQDKILCNRYDNHSEFFLNELRDSVLSAYDIQPDPHYLVFYGCSNGGDYGMRLLLEHPEKFTHFLCYSPIATTGKGKIFRTSHSQAHLFLSYSQEELESPFGSNLVKLNHTVQKKKDSRISVHIYAGGHKRAAWEKEFTHTLPLIFNPSKPSLTKQL